MPRPHYGRGATRIRSRVSQGWGNARCPLAVQEHWPALYHMSTAVSLGGAPESGEVQAVK